MEGWRREAQDFLGDAGAVAGGAVDIDVEGQGRGGGTGRSEGVGAVGTTGIFSADTGISRVSSSGDKDIASTSLFSPTSFPSLVLATNNKACDNAGEPVRVGVSIVSIIITLEDRTLEFA